MSLFCWARDHSEVEALNLMCVEESAATDLNDGVDVTAYIRQPPVLGVVVLERPGDHVEVPLRDLVSVQESNPAPLQSDGPLTRGDLLPRD